MAESSEPITIKKYANRRLYNTGTSTYVTLEDLATMVRREEDFAVVDAKTGEDITRSVLTQIIFEQENKGQNLLPIAFLRQLIRFYGDSIQAVVPSYLEFSIDAFTREQEKMRSSLTRAFGGPAAGVIEEQVRTNAEMFERAMRMFLPLGREAASEETSETKPNAAGPSGEELDDLKRQLADMQKKIDALSSSDS